MKQFSVFLLNKVGALLELVKLLNDHDVHVLALNSQDSTDSALVRLIVSDPDMVESLFELHEIAYSISEILVVEMRETAVDLKRMLQALLMAEVNIQVCYPILYRPHGRSALALHVDDLDCSWTVLAGEGFQVLHQIDLSR
ncbi:MAG: acetolactate synthase [Verrucomicrobia bacterium]|nr:acetolactate synthase [Verrucomicrobiota bacterium]